MFVLFLEGVAKDQDLVYVGETKFCVFKDFVHEALEVLGGVSKAKGHEGGLEKAEGCGYSSLLDVVGMYGDLMVSPHEVDFGKVGAARNAVGIVPYVRHWIPVGNDASVNGSVVCTRYAAAVLFGH